MFLFRLFVLIGIFHIALSANAQTVDIWITGTSTLHDWNVKAEEVSSYPEALNIEEGASLSVQDFSFEVRVESMDGGRGASMNKKIYTALKSSEYPSVRFEQIGRAEFQEVEKGDLSGEVEGSLSIAGVAKQISFTVEGAALESEYHFKGSVPMKLSDFSIDPPSAMFGQIQTKDDIVVHFEVAYPKI